MCISENISLMSLHKHDQIKTNYPGGSPHHGATFISMHTHSPHSPYVCHDVHVKNPKGPHVTEPTHMPLTPQAFPHPTLSCQYIPNQLIPSFFPLSPPPTHISLPFSPPAKMKNGVELQLNWTKHGTSQACFKNSKIHTCTSWN